MKIRILSLLVIAVMILLLDGCKRNHYKVNVSSIDAGIEIKRLEQDLFSLNPEEISSSLPELKEKYKGFLGLFSMVINTGDVNDPSFGDLITRFCTDKMNNEVYSLTMSVFPDATIIKDELERSFRHYLYYFPEKNVPAIFTCITGFNTSIITGDSVLGIGLDRYLGADTKYYPMLGIYKYISARMTPENIITDCMYGWGSSEWNYRDMDYPAFNLLSEMIHEGKLKYFQKCMLPAEKDEMIFGFTPEQMKFCLNNEGEMWTYLIEHDLLFSTDQFIIRKFTGEAPFTSYFTNESPGRATVWIGFRIVESYMMKNKDIGLSSLMNNTEIQQILEKARYSPD